MSFTRVVLSSFLREKKRGKEDLEEDKDEGNEKISVRKGVKKKKKKDGGTFRRVIIIKRRKRF